MFFPFQVTHTACAIEPGAQLVWHSYLCLCMVITILDALTALAAAVASRIVQCSAALQPSKCGADLYRCFVHPAGFCSLQHHSSFSVPRQLCPGRCRTIWHACVVEPPQTQQHAAVGSMQLDSSLAPSTRVETHGGPCCSPGGNTTAAWISCSGSAPGPSTRSSRPPSTHSSRNPSTQPSSHSSSGACRRAV